jgi:hypothetical protein
MGSIEGQPMGTAGDYSRFIADKSQWRHEAGFAPTSVPDFLFDFQKHLFEYACNKGRSAIFADCGMGKTAIELAFGDEVVRRENKPALLLTPLAVGQQVIQEAEKFGIPAKRSRSGEFDGSKCIWVTNYEQLSKFNPDDFCGVIGDESSRIKGAKSATKHEVTEFMRRIKYRLLCTATAAPNDYHELGTSSEALGLLGFRDMITTFFKQETSKDGRGWGRTKYRFRGHAQEPFWAWVCSWARSCRKPSDLGFDDTRFILPEMVEREYVVATAKARAGMLFALPGANLQEEREERRNSIHERCDKAAELAASHDGHSVLWCELNPEGDELEKRLPGSKQIKGSMPDEQKEEYLTAFSNKEIKHLITKPKIGAWGLNWQHCHNSVHLPSHSYEQLYQATRRFYRFGQTKPVTISLVVNEGEAGILKSLRRKTAQMNNMFASVVRHMQDAMHLSANDFFPETEELPKWLA